NLKFRGQGGLFCLEEFGAALDFCNLESTPAVHIVHILAQRLRSEGSLLLGGLFLKLRDENSVVESVHFERDVVLCILELVAGSGNLRRSDAVLLVDSQKLC